LEFVCDLSNGAISLTSNTDFKDTVIRRLTSQMVQERSKNTNAVLVSITMSCTIFELVDIEEYCE